MGVDKSGLCRRHMADWQRKYKHKIRLEAMS